MKKKALIMVLAAVVLVIGSVAGTLAYLTATTNTLTNTFTTGAITSLTLSEVKVDDNGKALESGARINTSAGNNTQNFPMYPGAVLAKDPTVTVGAGSVPAYVFVKYTSNIPTAAADITINSAWKKIDDAGIYVYTSNGTDPAIVTATAATDLTPLFTAINVKKGWDGTGFEAAPPVITVKAYAHQANVDGTAAYTTAETAAKALTTW